MAAHVQGVGPYHVPCTSTPKQLRRTLTCSCPVCCCVYKAFLLTLSCSIVALTRKCGSYLAQLAQTGCALCTFSMCKVCSFNGRISKGVCSVSSFTPLLLPSHVFCHRSCDWRYLSRDLCLLSCDLCHCLFFRLQQRARDIEGKLSLDDLLIKPVQRIPRYALFIKDLLKHTSASHPDHSPLLQALGELTTLAERVNESQRESHRLERQRELLTSIDGLALVREGEG